MSATHGVGPAGPAPAGAAMARSDKRPTAPCSCGRIYVYPEIEEWGPGRLQYVAYINCRTPDDRPKQYQQTALTPDGAAAKLRARMRATLYRADLARVEYSPSITNQSRQHRDQSKDLAET